MTLSPLRFDIKTLKTHINKYFKDENDRMCAEDPVNMIELPVGFMDAAEYALTQLLEEGHFTIEDTYLVLNWDELTLNFMFEHVLHFMQGTTINDADINFDDLCKVSNTFDKLMSYGNHETDAVAVAIFKSFDAMVGYDTEISEFVFGFQFYQVKHSYQEAAKRNPELGDFDTQLTNLFGIHLPAYLARVQNCRLRGAVAAAA
jgi:hypothetical protein